MRDKGSGEIATKVATWHKPDEMNDYDAKRALDKFVVEFEEKARNDYAVGLTKKKDLSVNEYAKIWFDYLKSNREVSYYASIKPAIDDITLHLGGYKLSELSPAIIQRFIEKIKKKQIVNVYATDKTFIKNMVKNRMSKDKASRLSGVATSTILKLERGQKIEYEKANILATVFDGEVEDMFNIIKTEKPYESATVAKRYRVLRSMLSLAKKQQYVEHNYAKSEYIETIKETHKDKKFLDDEQAKEYLNGLKYEEDIRKRTALTLLIFTGIRRGEICGLEWEDIDFIEKTISIKRSSVQVTGCGVITKGTKTTCSTRTIAIPSSLVELLKEYQVWWNNYIESIGDKCKEKKRLFIQKDGRGISPNTIYDWHKAKIKELNLPDVNLHSLRHSNISIQLASGIPLKTVSARAGHSDTRVTAQVYAHLLKSSNIEAADKLQEVLG